MDPLGYALLIEGLVVMIYGVVRGGVGVRRFIAAGTALILAYALPTLLGIAPPGSPTYLILYREVEGLVGDWSLVYYSSAYAGLAWAVGMTVLNVVAVISTLGIGAIPLQGFTVIQGLGFIIDPIADVIFAVMHVAQVMTAVLHTIAYLAWFSYAIAPLVIGIAAALMVMDRTRAAGAALFIVTLTILFITTIAAKDAMIASKNQLMNETTALMNWLTQNAPNAVVRGFLILGSPYPYLVGGVLYGVNYTVIGRSVALTEYPVSGFTAFTGSVTPINAFGTPEITNTTFLWLLVNPGHDCLLLTYAGNQSTAEPCDSAAYLSSNATYAEVIEFGNPPFNVVTATLNGSTLYTGAWQWLDSPSKYSVLNGNNTAAINFTINVPPMRCINVTNPRTGVTHGECFPGVASATLWYFAGDALINVPTRVGNSTTCQYSVLNSTLYRTVSINDEESELRDLVSKINEEVTIGREITGMGRNLSLALPNPEPVGYSQVEITVTCINHSNETVTVPGVITIIGNINNPWFGTDPIGLTPSTTWVINSMVVGSQRLLTGWSYFNGLLLGVGYFIPKWLAEAVAILGLLDAAMWIANLPTPLSPAWSVLSNVVMDLSLILYLRVAGVSRVLGRLFRRVRSSVASRVRGLREGVALRMRRGGRLGGVVGPLMVIHHEFAKAVSALRGSRPNHPAWRRLSRHLPSPWDPSPLARPVSAAMEDVESMLRGKAVVYGQRHRRALAGLARVGAGVASFVGEYPIWREAGMRGRLHEVVGLRFRGGAVLDRRVYSRGGGAGDDLPAHLVTRAVARRIGIKRAVEDAFASLSMPRPFEVKAVKDPRLRGLMESLVSKYWLGGGKGLVVKNSRLDSARLLAIALTPYVRELHGKALTGIRRLSEVKGVINALINGELHRLVELSQLMGVEHGRARELLDKALGNRARELMSKHMRDRQVRELARGDVKLIIDALHNLRGGVALSRDVLKPLLEAFRDDAKAIEVINSWWVRHTERINKALSGGASSEDLMIINRLSVRELTKALSPFVGARFREALESRAWGAAVKEALPMAIGEFLRNVNYGGWVREQVRGFMEFGRFMGEYGGLLRHGVDALVGDKSFSEVFPRIASIVRSDLLVDSVVRLHLAVTARDGVINRLSVGGRASVIGLIDYADSIRKQPLVALLELLSELGVDVNRAIEWQSFSEEYGRLRIGPGELKALARALRALHEDGFVDMESVEGVARDLVIKASMAKPNSDVFREFHKDLWGLVLSSDQAKHVRGGFIGVDSISDDGLRHLLARYMPPRLAIEVLSQVRDYAVGEAEVMLRGLASRLSSEVDELRGRLRDLEAKLSDLVGSGGLGGAEELSGEVGELRRRLAIYGSALGAVNNALNALSHTGAVDLRIQLLRSSINALRDSLGRIINEFRDAELGLKVVNLMEAVVVAEALIDGLGRYVGDQPNK
ncbi:hypothetical protein [Vulcanisaeta distributa]|uniref:Uncharacterized protein n=1 Tax=Vulcanisaeta distributa (strain DSM 14429 / JCM 11212 / NBRC 100878 / IC-017) TaxID=572478 RepID=E1QSN2_VULDI|nr:hypothetical protein [Vulcanisaeta distributa]ADN49549.1 hypothetical protein Vdis_0136 [Vulcanisaeta distributa DSM 14429]